MVFFSVNILHDSKVITTVDVYQCCRNSRSLLRKGITCYQCFWTLYPCTFSRILYRFLINPNKIISFLHFSLILKRIQRWATLSPYFWGAFWWSFRWWTLALSWMSHSLKHHRATCWLPEVWDRIERLRANGQEEWERPAVGPPGLSVSSAERGAHRPAWLGAQHHAILVDTWPPPLPWPGSPS